MDSSIEEETPEKKKYELVRMTTENTDLYRTSSKMILVTRDPVYSHKSIIQGQYIGPKPYSYLPLAIFVTIINPILGPISILFSLMSDRAYKRGDLTYSFKWSMHSFFWSVVTVVASLVLYTAIGFALSSINTRGGYVGY